MNTTKPFLSFCAIVKDEQENLPRCLASVRPHVEEMIIVDTGSQDNTPAIAQEYGAKVSYFQWCDDFAKARNYAISQVSGEWILMLDADEELVVKTANFRDLIGSKFDVYILNLVDAYQAEEIGNFQPPRLFRNIANLRYQDAFHEQLKYDGRDIPLDKSSFLDALEILHYGYHQEQLKQKAATRILLLENLLEKDGLNLMIMLTLEGMYKLTNQQDKRDECHAQVLDYLSPYLIEGSPPELFRSVTSWLFLLGLEALQNQDYETTILICQRGLQWCYSYPPLDYLTGEVLLDLGFALGAIPYFRNCLAMGKMGTYNKSEPFDLSFTQVYPAHRLGCAYSELKSWQKALDAFNLALSFNPNYPPAQQGLETAKQYLNY